MQNYGFRLFILAIRQQRKIFYPFDFIKEKVLLVKEISDVLN